MFKKIVPLSILLFLFANPLTAQVDEDKVGAWYIYNWNIGFGESQFGIQSDIQYRNWNIIGDLEQLLLRAGVTYKPVDGLTFTLGYGHITSGEFGDGTSTSAESRVYQDAIMPHKVGKRFYLNHRFRFEQRWVENQDFRTRYRYNLVLNIPLNKEKIEKNAFYLSLYDEIFLNGQRKIGEDRTVEIFDRNRLYGALGYAFSNKLRFQLGYMRQTTNTISKDQLQFTVFQSF